MLKSLPIFYFKKSRRTPRSIVPRNIVTFTYYKKSFQNEVLNYFENSEDNSPELSKEPLIYQNGKVQMYRDDLPQLHNMALKVAGGNVKEKFDAIFKAIDKLSNTTDEVIKREYRDDIDMKCFSVVNYLQPSEILKLLNAFFKIIPNEFKTSYFYDKAIANLINFAESRLLTPHETVQLLWFISLNGSKYTHYMVELEPYMPDIDKLPLMEKCILVQSFYSTSRPLTSRQTYVIVKTLERDFKQLISNPNFLVVLCKALLISETSIDNIRLDKLTENILNMKLPIPFLTATYLLNLYALTRIYEEKAIIKLVKQSIERIKEDLVNNKFSIPLIHFEKFLWSISVLGIYLTLNEKTIIKPYMEQRYGEYRSLSHRENLSYLLNSIVSSIMLRCWSTKLLKQCLEEKVFNPFFQNSSRYKLESQVQLLLTLLSTEVKMINFIPREYHKEINFKYTISENINIVADIADDLAKKNLINDVDIECPINCIRIPGVTFSTATETYHIDVLDELTCFRETTLPHGLAQLKFRLLSRLGYRLIKIDGNIFKDDTEKIITYIEMEILNKISYGTGWVLKNKKGQKSTVDKKNSKT